MLYNIKLGLCYKGVNYSGFQSQVSEATVAGDLNKALSQLYKKEIKLVAAGRTDTGVHAQHQVVSYKDSLHIPEEGILKGLNSLLSADIRVHSAKYVDLSFSARHSAVSRSYVYLFSDHDIPMVFDDFVVPFSTQPNFEVFQYIRERILGTHDFSCFKCEGSTVLSSIKTILDFDLKESSQTCPFSKIELPLYEFHITANSFLYKMVRNIVGALFEVLKGGRDPEEFVAMFTQNTPKYYYKVAPAKGLSLLRVAYD